MDQTGLQRDGYQSYPITTTAVAAAANMTASSRYRSPHGTSSAFSINASPSEDWTKISDLAERRRVQNRIAQRNYRKRLKRRLEDLERKAPSTSASPEPSQAETPQQPKPSQSPKVNRAATRKRKTSTSIHVSKNANHTSLNSSQSPLPQQQLETYGTMPEERGGSSNIYTKQLSSRQIATSTPTEPFFYPSYPTSQAIYDYNSSYQSPQPNAFQTMPQSHYGELPGQVACQQYLDRSSQRSLSPNSSPSKQMNAFSNDQDLNPLHVNYAPIIGLEAPVYHQPQYNQQTHTPPLTNAYSDGYSTSTSPAGSLNEHFPLTPERAGSSPDYIIYR